MHVLDWLVGKSTVTVKEVLEQAIRVPRERQELPAQKRVAAVLKAHGWTQRSGRVESEAKPVRVYHRLQPAALDGRPRLDRPGAPRPLADRAPGRGDRLGPRRSGTIDASNNPILTLPARLPRGLAFVELLRVAKGTGILVEVAGEAAGSA